MQHSVLIVENDFDIAGLVQVHLTELNLLVDHVTTGDAALTKLTKQDYQIVLLDIMLPGIDGLSLCREIKTKMPHVSVVFLSSKNSEMDRIIGLEMGADDYICKPFSYRELQARIKTQLRHIRLLQQNQTQPALTTPQHQALNFGALHIDPASHEVRFEGEDLPLTATEFELMVFFAKHPNQVFSRSQLLESVWGYGHCGYEHTVNSHINRLRGKLEKYAKQHVIETVWGVGYKLNAKSLAVAAL
ncbi:chemotaxis protein CheY [Pseudoalteromonas piratica]|uniref:Phosphate regulon transcriptional regulatory protein PhoB n=2 Tax=Pseudoalteromonas piratica TaxID=1348114 RepID=A0A0A7EMA1_9GAMM|nr:response regulator transcription factor [Pseudoalteromonas piratica]AIY67648.1 chemotaxis protein CheY [Pseudoalteromonas piratica]